MYAIESKALDLRRVELLAVALELCDAGAPYDKITRDGLADAAGVSRGTVSTSFGGMPRFREALIEHAVEARHLRIIAGAVVNNEPGVQGIDAELKAKALQHLYT